MNVIGFDDGPFARDHRGNVLLVGVVCSGTRVDGIVSGRMRRDGADSTRKMVELVRASQFAHVQSVLLQGIAVGGFNVVDVHSLSRALQIPVLVIVRKRPGMASVHRALFSETPSGSRPRVAGASRKWKLIEAAGELASVLPADRSNARPACTRAGQSFGSNAWASRSNRHAASSRQRRSTGTSRSRCGSPTWSPGA